MTANPYGDSENDERCTPKEVFVTLNFGDPTHAQKVMLWTPRPLPFMPIVVPSFVTYGAYEEPV